jgi:hypothetical protein
VKLTRICCLTESTSSSTFFSYCQVGIAESRVSRGGPPRDNGVPLSSGLLLEHACVCLYY